MPLAFSYLRFSSPQQATGDSIRRQTEKTADWCRRNKVQLDESMTLRDEGVSAFKGKHRTDPAMHALAAFVHAVKAGRVPEGSYLVVESLDRLSREKIRPALTLLLNLIESGVKVVQLMPVETVYDEDVEPMALLQAIMELNRGHSESKVKSERVGAAWARKRKEAGTRILTRKLPGWIAYDNGRLKLIPERAKVVRRVFEMALAGNGVHGIAKILNAGNVPTMGRKVFKGREVTWNETVVYNLLKSRSTYGEFQPSKGRGSQREAVGDPIPKYYPPVIDHDTFLAVSSALRSRSNHGSGRRGMHVNLFSGLLVDARTGGSLTYKHTGNRAPALIPVGAKQGRDSVWSSFPAEPFESAILLKLREVTVADVRGDDSVAKRIDALTGKVSELDALVKVWTAKMDNPAIVDTVAAKLVDYNTERKAVVQQLTEAQREAATPLSAAWGEALGLLDVLEQDRSEEMRLRFRAAIRRSIESVHCLFLGNGRTRLAAVRVQFRGGERHRDYLIRYEPGRSNRHLKRQGEVEVLSFADAGVSGGIDLRKPDDVRKVEKLLAKLELAIPATC